MKKIVGLLAVVLIVIVPDGFSQIGCTTLNKVGISGGVGIGLIFIVEVDIAKQLKGGYVISAGFVEILNGEVKCYGASGSLNIKSNPEDSKLLANQLGLVERITA